ncbi:MAG: CBS domain-containing protein [Halioglobus sp.]
MIVFKDLNPLITSTICDIQRPSTVQQLHLHSPAMEVFTDFSLQNPLMLEQNTSIDDARAIMRSTHTKLFLVIDAQESFRGVITLNDLVSEKVMEAMDRSRLPRHELTVEHVMTPRSKLRAIDFGQYQLATIGDVLARMQKYGEQHMIVVETESASIRGIVSAHGIARRMHAPVFISERAVSFSEIYKALTG